MFCISWDVSAAHTDAPPWDKGYYYLLEEVPRSRVAMMLQSQKIKLAMREHLKWWGSLSAGAHLHILLTPRADLGLRDLEILRLWLNSMILRVSLNNPVILWLKDINFLNCSLNVLIFSYPRAS